MELTSAHKAVLRKLTDWADRGEMYGVRTLGNWLILHDPEFYKYKDRLGTLKASLSTIRHDLVEAGYIEMESTSNDLSIQGKKTPRIKILKRLDN